MSEAEWAAARAWLDAMTGSEVPTPRTWKCAGCAQTWLSPAKATECSDCGDGRIYRFYASPSDPAR